MTKQELNRAIAVHNGSQDSKANANRTVMRRGHKSKEQSSTQNSLKLETVSHNVDGNDLINDLFKDSDLNEYM